MEKDRRRTQRVLHMAAGTRGQGHDRHGCQCSLTGRSKMPAANERPVARGWVYLVPSTTHSMLTILSWDSKFCPDVKKYAFWASFDTQR